MTKIRGSQKEVLNGEVNIYLNTKGTDSSGVSGELVALLKYFEETTDERAISSGYERIIRLSEIVSAIKANDEIGVKYMNAYEERILDIKEAREQGEEHGRTEGEKSGRAAEKLEIAKALKSKGVDIDIIAETSGLSKTKIKML